MAEDNDTRTRINKLVAEEKDLRAKLQRGEISGDEVTKERVAEQVYNSVTLRESTTEVAGQ